MDNPYLIKSIRGTLIFVKKTTIGLVNVVRLKQLKSIRIETTQKNTKIIDNFLTFLVSKGSELLVTSMNNKAIENNKATDRNRLPEGSKLTIFATVKNSNEKPNNFLDDKDNFALKNRKETKIRLK